MTTSSSEGSERSEIAMLPASPAGRSATLAVLPAPDLGPGLARIATEATAVLLAVTVAFGPIALVVPLVAALAVSTQVALAGETVWFGADWIASKGLLPSLVVGAEEVVEITGPTDIGGDGADLVVRTSSDRAIRVRAERLAADAGASWSLARFLTAAQAEGATVTPGAWAFVSGVDRW